MRTTLTIDDDVLMAAKDLAAYEGKSVGQVISELARRSLVSPPPRTSQATIPQLPIAPGATRATLDIVNRLRDELP